MVIFFWLLTLFFFLPVLPSLLKSFYSSTRFFTESSILRHFKHIISPSQEPSTPASPVFSSSKFSAFQTVHFQALSPHRFTLVIALQTVPSLSSLISSPRGRSPSLSDARPASPSLRRPLTPNTERTSDGPGFINYIEERKSHFPIL